MSDILTPEQREEMKTMYSLSEDEITRLMEKLGFKQLFQEDKEYFFHYQPKM